MLHPTGLRKACIKSGICWNALLSKRISLRTFPQYFAEIRLMVAVVPPRRSPILPRSIHLLGFHSCTFSFGESVWETGTSECATLEMTVLPEVANVTTDPSYWSRSHTPPQPLASLQSLKISSKEHNLPKFKQGEVQGSPKSETTWFGKKELLLGGLNGVTENK